MSGWESTYDDYDYCEACRRHSRDCWCWSQANLLEAQEPDEVCPGGEGHD